MGSWRLFEHRLVSLHNQTVHRILCATWARGEMTLLPAFSNRSRLSTGRPPNVFLRTYFKRINGLLDDISAGKVSCKSNYDRARQVYRVASKEEKAGLYVLVVAEMVLP